MGNSQNSSADGDDAAVTDSAPTAEGTHEEEQHVRPLVQREKTQKILVEADRRDDEADTRDAESDKRAEAADLHAFLNTSEPYFGHGERRAAALDRSHAKDDRESSAADRAELSKPQDDPDAEDKSSSAK